MLTSIGSTFTVIYLRQQQSHLPHLHPRQLIYQRDAVKELICVTILPGSNLGPYLFCCFSLACYDWEWERDVRARVKMVTKVRQRGWWKVKAEVWNKEWSWDSECNENMRMKGGVGKKRQKRNEGMGITRTTLARGGKAFNKLWWESC